MKYRDLTAIDTEISRSTRMLINSNWNEIAAFLPMPGRVWKWSECNLGHRLKYNLKNADLICRSPGGERWQTTIQLWRYVISKAGENEEVGTPDGQELLVDPLVESKTPMNDRTALKRTLHNTPSFPTVQTTLTGEVLDPTEFTGTEGITDQMMARTLWKDPTSDDSRTAAAYHPDQHPITAWCTDGSLLNAWKMTYGNTTRLTVPSQEVY